MKGTDYEALVRLEADATGRDPDEAYREFTELAHQIRGHREEGRLLQAELQQLYPMYGHYRKGEPYEREAKLLPQKELNARYRVLREQQKRENAALVITTRRANKLLGGDYIDEWDQVPQSCTKEQKGVLFRARPGFARAFVSNTTADH